jgi:hypothetical protein
VYSDLSPPPFRFETGLLLFLRPSCGCFRNLVTHTLSLEGVLHLLAPSPLGEHHERPATAFSATASVLLAVNEAKEAEAEAQAQAEAQAGAAKGVPAVGPPNFASPSLPPFGAQQYMRAVSAALPLAVVDSPTDDVTAGGDLLLSCASAVGIATPQVVLRAANESAFLDCCSSAVVSHGIRMRLHPHPFVYSVILHSLASFVFGDTRCASSGSGEEAGSAVAPGV